MSSSQALSLGAEEQELLAFRKALIALGNSDLSTLAKFSKMLKNVKLEDPEVKLDPEEKKLADAICGVSSKLPLLQLPTVPLTQILRNLDEFDIIKLSLLSQKTKRIVRSANYPIKDVEFYGHKKRWCLYGAAIMIVNFSTKVEVIDSQQEEKKRFKVIGGMEITCESETRGGDFVRFICPAGVDKKSIREFAHRHFLEVFRKIENIDLRFFSGNLKEFDLWNYTKNIFSLSVGPYHPEEISAEDMKFALEEVETSYLKIFNKVQHGFRFSTGFKADDVFIFHNSGWVDLDAVINSTSSSINLMCREVEITRSQINNLLKLWISGERMVNLTRLDVSYCRIIGEGEDVFDGIEIQSYEDGRKTCIVARYNGQLARIAIRNSEFSFTMNA